MPCELEGGVLDDGTCQWGFPALLPENVAAVDLFADINLLGWDAATGLREWALDRSQRDELLAKLRVLAATVKEIEAERLKVVKSGGHDPTTR